MRVTHYLVLTTNVLRTFNMLRRAPAAIMWKRLIDCPPVTSERISLITAVFSDKDEIEVVQGLCKDDAQAFIDIVDEVRTSSNQTHLLAFSLPGRSDFSSPRSCATAPVAKRFVENMWLPYFTPEITAYPTLL